MPPLPKKTHIQMVSLLGPVLLHPSLSPYVPSTLLHQQWLIVLLRVCLCLSPTPLRSLLAEEGLA